MATYKGKFVPKNPSKYKGNKNNIVYRSSYELKMMNYCDMHPDIIYWSSEELAVRYISPFDKKPHRYFPDFIIEMKDKDGNRKKIMIEIKPHSQTNAPVRTEKKKQKTLINETVRYRVNRAKWAAAKEFCDKHGMQFLILTEKELFKNGK